MAKDGLQRWNSSNTLPIMRIAIISDVHANADAMRRVLVDAHNKGVSRIVCLGDIVGYGPLPTETIDLVRKNCAVVLSGNHDAAVVGRIHTDDFSLLAANAIDRHRADLNRHDLDYLASLPLIVEENGFIAAHGDFVDPAKFYYVQSIDEASANFTANAAQLMFIGHTHSPSLFLTGNSGSVYNLPPTDFVLEDGKRYIVNVGSVGYPREEGGICRSSYVIYDTIAQSVTFHYLPFDIATIIQRNAKRPINNKRTLIITIAAIATIAIAILSAFFRANRSDGQNPTLTTRSISVQSGAKSFLPNLFLAPHSAPVMLRVTFKNNSGKAIKTEGLIVKQRREQAFGIPSGTTIIEATLTQVDNTNNRANQKVNITGFTPTIRY